MNRDELLAAVVESPNDDGPRLVYADWLLQQWNPVDRARGEYISLACSAAQDADRAKKRMKELLAKYQAAWLGPVADVLDLRWLLWSRGFLESCALVHPTKPMEPALGHPTWRTLRTLVTRGSNYDEVAIRGLLTQPEIANLRGLYTDQVYVERMTEWPGAPRVLELGVAPAGTPLARLAPLMGTDCLARVRRLHVFGCSPEVGCTFARPGLTLISVAGPDSLARWLATLAATEAAFDEVRLVTGVYYHLARHGLELVVRRVDARWSALEVRWGDVDEPRLRERAIVELARLAEGTLTHLSFVGPPTKRFDVARFRQRILNALVPRQPDLQVG